ncbi:MAG: hypothetical protein GX552_06945 [Chloroflexi bacterium]|jgi:MFS family permease|nr:hypothetical protein [Chloroflexota bacterium]
MAGSAPERIDSDTVMYCVNHPKRETLIRCSRCLDPICTKCAVRTPVGLRCPKCAQVGRSPLYVLRPQHYVVGALVALAVSLVAGAIVARLGMWLAFFLAAPIGGLIAEAVNRTTRKRGRILQIITAVAIGLGAFAGPVIWVAISAGGLPTNPMLYLRTLLNLGSLLYVVLAIGAAVARLN